MTTFLLDYERGFGDWLFGLGMILGFLYRWFVVQAKVQENPHLERVVKGLGYLAIGLLGGWLVVILSPWN